MSENAVGRQPFPGRPEGERGELRERVARALYEEWCEGRRAGYPRHALMPWRAVVEESTWHQKADELLVSDGAGGREAWCQCPAHAFPHDRGPACTPVSGREAKLGTLLRELHALVRGECPSLLNEDSGGDARLALDIEDVLGTPPSHPEPERGTKPPCGACGSTQWTFMHFANCSDCEPASREAEPAPPDDWLEPRSAVTAPQRQIFDRCAKDLLSAVVADALATRHPEASPTEREAPTDADAALDLVRYLDRYWRTENCDPCQECGAVFWNQRDDDGCDLCKRGLWPIDLDRVGNPAGSR